jgi:mono/diheme cytochrome c family protein
MRKFRLVCVLLGVVAIAGVGAGCAGEGPQEAETPPDAATITNQAQQTDSTGATVTAPPAGATTEATDTAAAGGDDAAAVAAGQTVFQAVCQGCHLAGGDQAGIGPKLSDAGLSEEQIRSTVMNGGGGMPANLATGADLDTVTAYVVSIQ